MVARIALPGMHDPENPKMTMRVIVEAMTVTGTMVLVALVLAGILLVVCTPSVDKK